MSVRATDGTLDRPRASVIRKTDLKTLFTRIRGTVAAGREQIRLLRDN